jgi:hypothetical protein
MRQRLGSDILPKHERERLRRDKAAARQARRQEQSRLRKLLRKQSTSSGRTPMEIK